jgi:CRP-like cAMP-binding protein
MESREILSGVTIFNDGDSDSSFFLVEDGSIRIQRMTPFGPFELENPRPGELFSETGFLDGSPREGDAEATADSIVIAFDTEALATLCSSDQRFDLALHWALWKSLSNKLRSANNRLSEFFSTEATEREIDELASDRGEAERSFDMSSKLGLFREQKLSEMEINFLASLSREERFEPGQMIFQESARGDKMYIVAEGSVMISKTIPGIGEEALAFLERGDYFGEMALIEDQPRSADARAHPQAGATVLALPREVVSGLLNIEKVSSIRLLKILSRLAAKRVRELNEKLVGLYQLAGGDLKSSLD